MKPKFTSSDAWLLLAVALASCRQDAPGKGGATLKDVIAAGDVIQHAIFTPAELRRGFAKLIAAGHVQADGERFSLVGAASAEYEHIKRSAMTLWKQLEAMEAFLSAARYPAGDPNYEDPDWPYPALSDEVIEAACKARHNEAERLGCEIGEDFKGT